MNRKHFYYTSNIKEAACFLKMFYQVKEFNFIIYFSGLLVNAAHKGLVRIAQISSKKAAEFRYH